MIILDENIVDAQRLLLESWNVTARQIGLDVGRKGCQWIAADPQSLGEELPDARKRLER